MPKWTSAPPQKRKAREVLAYARRRKMRAKRAEALHYPFGLLTILDLIGARSPKRGAK